MEPVTTAKATAAAGDRPAEDSGILQELASEPERVVIEEPGQADRALDEGVGEERATQPAKESGRQEAPDAESAQVDRKR